MRGVNDVLKLEEPLSRQLIGDRANNKIVERRPGTHEHITLM